MYYFFENQKHSKNNKKTFAFLAKYKAISIFKYTFYNKTSV